jgi:hypothetical protein
MKTILGIFVAILGATSAFAIQAQHVPVSGDQSLTPQIEIAGVGIGTLNAGRNGDQASAKAKSGINFSDSDLMIGAAQRLGDGQSIGSTGLGWLTLDETNKGLGTQLFLNQGFLDYQGERFEALIGRTDNPTAHLIDFPSIRGDDMVTLLNPLNPFSNGQNVEEHRYSNVAAVTINQDFKYFETVHVQHLINSAGIGSDTGINSFGAEFQYLGPPGMDAFSTVPSFGFGYEHFTLVSETSSGLHQIYLGGTINLNQSVTNRWDLSLQDIAGFGSTLKTFRNVTDSFQANSNDIAASLRYMANPFGKMGYQFSLTGAFKNYFDVSQSNSFGGIFTAVKRLGTGFDLVAQYQLQSRNSALALVQSNSIEIEQTGEIGFVFSFDSTINQHLAPRRTLLNQEHHYVPN